MRRSLVVTDDIARHPFRASLPPHVRLGVAAVPIKRGWGLSWGDLRGFFYAYSACLLAVAVFIA